MATSEGTVIAVSLTEAPGTLADLRQPHSLYLHVPFCVSKCPYCDFNSHIGLEHLFASYADALVAEIGRWGAELEGPRLDTVFIGGGTPSRVPAEHIAAALAAVRDCFDLSPDAEVTIEANPQSAEAVKMEAWLAAGVNRLSLGFQSLDASALAFLERAHDAEEAVGVFRRARRAGFTNISCDLIFGVPGLTTERWREVLGDVIELQPDHVSAYELTPEPGTRLGSDVAAGRTRMPAEGVQLEQYEAAESVLAGAGFQRYEVSNWALPGRQCRHNVAYWSGVPYAAAGAGAHAYLLADSAPSWLRPDRPEAAMSVRQWNLGAPAAYVKSISARGHADAGHEWLDTATTLSDLAMMGLRQDSGVELTTASRIFGLDVAAAFAEPAGRLQELGLVECDGSTIRCTSRGSRLLNQVVAEFLP